MAEINVTIKCEECSAELGTTETVVRQGDIIIFAKPCAYCLKKEYERGYDKAGEDEGN